MATHHRNAIQSGVPTSGSARAVRCCVSRCLRTPPRRDVNQVPIASCPLAAGFATFTDVRDPPSTFRATPAASSSDGIWNHVTSHGVSTFRSLVRSKAAHVWLYPHIPARGVQVVVDALFERVASQEDPIADLECSQRAETKLCKRTIKETISKVDEARVCDGRNIRGDAFKNPNQSFKMFRLSMECQNVSVIRAKVDTNLKVILLRSDLARFESSPSCLFPWNYPPYFASSSSC